MNSITEEYSKVLKCDEQQYDTYIVLNDDTKVDVDISGFKTIYNLGERLIGNFANKRIEFTLFDTGKYNLTDKEFEAFVGLKVGNEFVYNSIGKYIANKPQIKDEALDESSIVANDISIKFKQNYVPVINFPCKIRVAVKAICDYLNVDYIENDFINADYVLQEFYIDEDATFYDVIKVLAEAGFANAFITYDNKFIMKSPAKNACYKFDLNELFEMKKEDNLFGPLNSIVASRIVADDESTTEDVYSRDETSITTNGLYEYKIKQNDAIDYDRQTAVDNMLAGILNFKYLPATIEAVYNPKLEVGDMLEVPDKNTDTSFLLFAKEITIDLSTGLMTIESSEESKTETNYKNATQKDKRTKTEIEVNKMKGKITMLSGSVAENEEKIAQQEITSEAIKESVSSLDENLEELKSQTEQTASKLEYTISKANGNNLVKNSDMSNDTEFWQAHLKAAFTEGNTPPENPEEDEYWYSTANYDVYVANQMYKYTNGIWVESALTRKLLNNALNLLQYTSSYDTDESKLNTASGRYIRVDVDNDYPNVTHSYNSTNLIPIDTNEEYVTMSVKVKNNIKLGNVMLLLAILPNFELPTTENPASMYEPAILLTPDDYNNELHQYTMTIKIPKRSEYISVVTGTTPPTDTTKYWLYEQQTGIGVIMQFDGDSWVQYKTDKVVYEEDTNLVWTYRALYGAYYKTNYTSDLDFKSITCVIAFYGGFALLASDSEPTPQKGLYWLDTTNNKCFRAKYNEEEFAEWEDTGLTATWVSQNIMPVINTPFVPPKGYFEFADLKVEWNSTATRWNRYQGEIYSKNFKLDENGFEISSGKNVMFIDEDEITASYNNINIFGINEDLCFTRRFKAEQEMALGNFKWYLAKVGNETQMLLN